MNNYDNTCMDMEGDDEDDEDDGSSMSEEERAPITLEVDEDDTQEAVGVTSQASLVDYVACSGGNFISELLLNGLTEKTITNSKMNYTSQLGALSALEVAVLKGDVEGARLVLNLAVQAAAKEAEFKIAAHNAGETLSLVELRYFEQAISNISLLSGLKSLYVRGVFEVGRVWLSSQVDLKSLVRLAILSEDKEMVDFIMEETLGLLDISSYAAGVVGLFQVIDKTEQAEEGVSSAAIVSSAGAGRGGGGDYTGLNGGNIRSTNLGEDNDEDIPVKQPSLTMVRI